MLSARALAEKSADMPRRITLWLASCRSASVPAVLSCAEAGSPRSAAASKRASASIGLDRRHLICAAPILALRTFIPAARRPDRTIEGRSTELHWAFQRRSNALRRVLNVTAARYGHFHTCRLKLGADPSSERVTRLSNPNPPNYLRANDIVHHSKFLVLYDAEQLESPAP